MPEQEYVLVLSKTMPNLTGLFLDDFFRGNAASVSATPFWLAESDVSFGVAFLVRNAVEFDNGRVFDRKMHP